MHEIIPCRGQHTLHEWVGDLDDELHEWMVSAGYLKDY